MTREYLHGFKPAGFRFLNVGEQIQSGDWTHSVLLKESGGLLNTYIPCYQSQGRIVGQFQTETFIRPS